MSELEIDLILLYYLMSDQYGRVDMTAVRLIAKNRLNVIIPDEQVILTQQHIDVLVANHIMPNISPIINNIRKNPKIINSKDGLNPK